jgi:hypothetical protein
MFSTVAPKIDHKAMKPIKVKAGQKLKIKVPVKGAPPPEVFWMKGGVIMKAVPKRRPPTKEEEAEMVRLKGIPKSKKPFCMLQFLWVHIGLKCVRFDF